MQILQFFNRQKHANFTFVFSQILALGVSASVLLHSTNVNAAEQVVLKYGKFQGVVSVKELNQFVETGKTTPVLQAYLQAAQQNPSVARKALTAGIKADRAFLNSLLSSWAGPILVSQIGEVIHPPEKQLDEQGLRTALSTSINQSGEVTLLGAIRNYPGASVEIEGDRLIEVYQRLSQFAKSF
ncbi:alpha/beta hydrolase [Fischerella sp. JS2]|uniref:alpha/beta hydrolase n=1 Tax=Fischerella sp. JS2 TaxID=2597771 RepID=UPI0028EF3B55|nr:alpha/beta hydrolase [Fischerella sp. JS2]